MQLKDIKLGRSKSIGPFKVSAYRVMHGLTFGFPTVGYRIDKKLGYISDVGKIPKKNFHNFKNLKLLFLDGAMWFGKRMKGHLNVEEAIELSMALKSKKTVLTQIGHGYPPYHQAVREINMVDGRVGLAYDGMKIKI